MEKKKTNSFPRATLNSIKAVSINITLSMCSSFMKSLMLTSVTTKQEIYTTSHLKSNMALHALMNYVPILTLRAALAELLAKVLSSDTWAGAVTWLSWVVTWLVVIDMVGGAICE